MAEREVCETAGSVAQLVAYRFVNVPQQFPSVVSGETDGLEINCRPAHFHHFLPHEGNFISIVYIVDTHSLGLQIREGKELSLSITLSLSHLFLSSSNLHSAHSLSPVSGRVYRVQLCAQLNAMAEKRKEIFGRKSSSSSSTRWRRVEGQLRSIVNTHAHSGTPISSSCHCCHCCCCALFLLFIQSSAMYTDQLLTACLPTFELNLNDLG